MNLSTQREAVLGLAADFRPCVTGPRRRYFLDGKEVFLLGFSEDAFYGTPVIAVFGFEPGSGSRNAAEESRFCAGAVFLRSTVGDVEADEAAESFGPETEVEIVESVTVSGAGPCQSALRRNGGKIAYPVLITAYRSQAA